MFEDRYGNVLTTSSAAARDAYVEGVDRFLATESGVAQAFQRSIDEDNGFALAHLGLARQLHASRKPSEAKQVLQTARGLVNGATRREAADVHALGLLIEGATTTAYKAIRAHLVDHPRAAFVAQTCTTVFGLIGFSGLSGREAEQLAFTATLAPHYGDDWWFLSQHAFSQVEVGQIALAEANIERSLALRPSSAQGAHIRAHVHYENGETELGLEFLSNWRRDYDRSGLLYGHLAWHEALWALEQGGVDALWKIIDQEVSPEINQGPPLVVLCDIASILFRASLKEIAIPEERWQSVAQYAASCFPDTGNPFGDVHAALAYATAGESNQLDRVKTDARGPAASVVSTLAEAFGAIADQNWTRATALLTQVMSEHARIGGSKAQRDLLECAMAATLSHQGLSTEARRFLAARRPVVPAESILRH